MFQHSAQSTNPIILKKGEYTRIDAFFAGVLTQISIYVTTDRNKDRCLESPNVIEREDGAFQLEAAAHKAALVDAFKDKAKKGSLPEAWQPVLAACPLQPKDERTLVARLSEFSKFKPAYYLSSFIDQFEKDMQKFIDANAEKLDELKLTNDPVFILNVAMLLSHAVSPFEGMVPADDETMSILTFYGIAANKFCDINSMSPRPSGTVASCCDAMRRVLSATLTQAIGEEKLYADMLGPPPQALKSGQKPSIYTPSQKMRDILESQELSREAVNAAAASVAILEGLYLIQDECFEVQENISHERLLWNLFYANIDFIDQADIANGPEKLYHATLLRLWHAFVKDRRCPPWIKAIDAEIQVEISMGKIPALLKSSVKSSSKNLPGHYLESVMMRAIQSVNHRDENSLNKVLKSLFREFLTKFLESYKVIFPLMSWENLFSKMKKDLHHLSRSYSKELSLSAKICSVFVEKAHQFLVSKEDQVNEDATLESLLLQIKSVDFMAENPDSLILHAPLMQELPINAAVKVIKDMLSLEGAVFGDLLASTLNEILQKYERGIFDTLREAVKKPDELEVFVTSLLPDEEINLSSQQVLSFEPFFEANNFNFDEKLASLILIDIVSQSSGLREQESFLKLLRSYLPFYSKLHFVGVIAQEMPKTFGSRALYFQLATLIDINGSNVNERLNKFLGANNPDKSTFPALNHALEYYAISSDRNNVGFETTFKRLVTFLVKTGGSCILMDFFATLPVDAEVVENCRKYLKQVANLSPQQIKIYNDFLSKTLNPKSGYAGFWRKGEAPSPTEIGRPLTPESAVLSKQVGQYSC